MISKPFMRKILDYVRDNYLSDAGPESGEEGGTQLSEGITSGKNVSEPSLVKYVAMEFLQTYREDIVRNPNDKIYQASRNLADAVIEESGRKLDDVGQEGIRMAAYGLSRYLFDTIMQKVKR